jgi:hypothetical protein
VGVALIERVASRGAIVGGVEIAGSDAGGRSEADATASIRVIARRLESEPVRVRIGPSDEVIAPATVGLRVDVPETVRRARAAGRGANPLAVLAGTVLRRFRPDEIPLVVSVDEGRLGAVLDAWSRATAVGLRDGSVRIEGVNVVEVAPRSGTGLREREARTQLFEAWSQGRSGPIVLSYGAVRPNVGRAAVVAAAAEARELLRRPHSVVIGPKTVTLPSAALAPTITVVTRGRRLVLGVDPDRLHAALAPELVGIERPPVDATWSGGGT